MKINFNDIVTALKGEVASPRLETRMILGHILSRESNDISPEEYELDEEQFSELRDIISKRLSKYPLDKLLGEKDFYKYRFKVSEDVLSPRPDTEVLVEARSGWYQSKNYKPYWIWGRDRVVSYYPCWRNLRI